jgi:hypothetical protein
VSCISYVRGWAQKILPVASMVLCEVGASRICVYLLGWNLADSIHVQRWLHDLALWSRIKEIADESCRCHCTSRSIPVCVYGYLCVLCVSDVKIPNPVWSVNFGDPARARWRGMAGLRDAYSFVNSECLICRDGDRCRFPDAKVPDMHIKRAGCMHISRLMIGLSG